MAQRRKGERALGPYPIGRKWRVVVVGEGGERDSRFYPTEEQAKAVVKAIRREFARADRKPVQEARDEYELYLRHDKGNKLESVKTTVHALNVFFTNGEMMLCELTPQKCAGYYDALRNRRSRKKLPFAVDTHRNVLANAKTFLEWCMTKKRWIARNPLAAVDGVGRRKHGKAQLRIDEARKWMAKATEFADAGEKGAVAAMMALLMGMRANEIVSRVVRDVDDGGTLLWIPSSKTEAGRRTLRVPEVLQPYLVRLTEGKAPEQELWGHHWRDWVRKWVQKICRAARVPSVSAHGMRGLHSTLAMETGMSAQIVAASLGHASSTTTLQSYASPEAVAGAQQRRVLRVLEGGKA